MEEERGAFYVQWREQVDTDDGPRSRLKRVSTCSDDKDAAKRFLADFINGWSTPTEEEKAAMTIRDVVKHYRAHKVKQYESRYKGDESVESRFIKRKIDASITSLDCAARLILEEFGELHHKQITRPLCRELARKRIEEDGISPSTAKKHFDLLGAALNHAKKDGLIDDVPFIEKPDEAPPRDKWARPHEVKQLLLALRKHPHLELFAMLALHTLSRKRAVTELKWAQVDLEAKLIDFNPPGRRRTAKRRVPVPINAILYNALVAAREVATTDYVIEFRGNPCYEIGRAFRKYARQADLGWITPHVLRHTGATLMAQQGVNIVQIAGIMGDRVQTVEKHYLKHHPDYLKDATTALEKIYA